VTAGTSISEAKKLELMSPILDDSLKQLPKSPLVNGAGHLPTLTPIPTSQSVTIAEEVPVKAQADIANTSVANDKESDSPSSTLVESSTGSMRSEPSVVSPRMSLHPSLPPKPAISFESNSKPPVASNFVHPSLPRKPVAIAVVSPPPKSFPIESDQHTSGPPHDASHTEPAAPETDSEELDVNNKGLEASMHAPKPSTSEPAISSLVPQTTIPPVVQRAFNPSHGRSHTVGRPPFTIGGSGLPHRSTQSGGATPLTATAHHGRTQSTPPAIEPRPARPTSRPVISGDALSRLARTLGGSGTSMSRKALMNKATSD